MESIDGIENAALAFVPEDYLSPLPRGATVAMIKKIGRVAGLEFDDSACETIGDCCGDMPFWVRKACSFIHRKTEVDVRPIQITCSNVMVLLEEFVQTEGSTLAHVALRHLFRVYPELEDAMRLCNAQEQNKASLRHLSVLQRYGLVSQNSSPVIAGQMLRLGFAIHLEERTISPPAVVPVISVAPERSEIDEWADELAVINRRRNLLEKRLRSIFLNFIRVDHLKTKTGNSVAARILGLLSADRQKKLQNRSAEECVEGLFWKELVELICDKEWSLFGQLMGDKTRFRQNCDLINDRPDAHAKTVDAADLALYRRSLKTVEDLIAKVM
jgi:hypothetical protein